MTISKVKRFKFDSGVEIIVGVFARGMCSISYASKDFSHVEYNTTFDEAIGQIRVAVLRHKDKDFDKVLRRIDGEKLEQIGPGINAILSGISYSNIIKDELNFGDKKYQEIWNSINEKLQKNSVFLVKNDDFEKDENSTFFGKIEEKLKKSRF